MAQWCSADEVQAYLAGLKGGNFTPANVQDWILKARDQILSDLGGKFSATVIDGWDTYGDAESWQSIPPQIRDLSARYAAAMVVQTYVDGESTGDSRSLAGGLYRQYKDLRDAIAKDTSIVATSDTDNTIVSGVKSHIKIVPSHADRTPTFTKGVQSDGDPGTFDNWGPF